MMTRVAADEGNRLFETEGRQVFTYDDELLGVVEAIIASRNEPDSRYLVVKGELYGTGRYYVPEAEIERVGPSRILLGLSRDDLREHDWLNPPPGISPKG